MELVDLKLWYKCPADPKDWNQALPIGNGSLGGMVFGGVTSDRKIWSNTRLVRGL